ncbi:MAG: hypothetical protein CM15mP103_04320 [Gammaproteobacteria bacterium]|nr:MAG: hypothetical protein CM15mP103_04320 [Gammaproteobacteria bacterium]
MDIPKKAMRCRGQFSGNLLTAIGELGLVDGAILHPESSTNFDRLQRWR